MTLLHMKPETINWSSDITHITDNHPADVMTANAAFKTWLENT